MHIMEIQAPEGLSHFPTNLGRVSSIVKGDTQRSVPTGVIAGQTDLLRAAVVLLHASPSLLRSAVDRPTGRNRRRSRERPIFVR